MTTPHSNGGRCVPESNWNAEIPLFFSSLQSPLHPAAAAVGAAATSRRGRAGAGTTSAAANTSAGGAAAAEAAAGATAPTSPFLAAAGISPAVFTSGCLNASGATRPAEGEKAPGRMGLTASSAAASFSPFSPHSPDMTFSSEGIPSALLPPEPAATAAASTAATTPAATGTSGVDASTSRLRFLSDLQQQSAVGGAVAARTPPTVDAAFTLPSADVVLLAKSFGHPLPSPHPPTSRLRGAADAFSPFPSTSSSFPVCFPLPQGTPPYRQITAPSVCFSTSAAVEVASFGSRLRWLLLQLLSLLTSAYSPSFYPGPSFSPSPLEAIALRVYCWGYAALCLLLPYLVYLTSFFPRLLRLIIAARAPPEHSPCLQGAFNAGPCCTEISLYSSALAVGNSASAFSSSSSFSSSVLRAPATSLYLIVDGACSNQAQQVDGGGAVLLTGLLPAATVAPPAATAAGGGDGFTLNGGSSLPFSSSKTVLYGHSPAAVILRNIGKTSSLEDALGVAYPLSFSGRSTSAGCCADAAARVSPPKAVAAAAGENSCLSWLGTAWQRWQQRGKNKKMIRRLCRYATAAALVPPGAGSSLLLTGYSDGRLETLQAVVAAAASPTSSKRASSCSYSSSANNYDSSSSGNGISSSSTFGGSLGRNVCFADEEMAEEDGGGSLEKKGISLRPSPPSEAAATRISITGTQQADRPTASSKFPAWQLVGVEQLQGPVVSLRVSPCGTRICALTSGCVYIFEVCEEGRQQQGTAHVRTSSSCCFSSCTEFSTSCGRPDCGINSGERGSAGKTRGRGRGVGALRRERSSFSSKCLYRCTRFSNVFAYGGEALYSSCTPVACCWTNASQLLLLSSEGKLSVFNRDPRKTVGEWRCMTRLQLDAAARQSLKNELRRSFSCHGGYCARQKDGSSNADVWNTSGSSSSSRRRQDSPKTSQKGYHHREGKIAGGKEFVAVDECEERRRRAAAFGNKDAALFYDGGVAPWLRVGTEETSGKPQQGAPGTAFESGDKTFLNSPYASSSSSSSSTSFFSCPSSFSTSSFSFSSPAAVAAACKSASVSLATAVAAAEQAWRGSFPVAVLHYSASLELLYLSIRGHPVLLAIPWKALYLFPFSVASSSFFYVPVSTSPVCTAAAALSQVSLKKRRRGGAGGLLAALRGRLLQRRARVLAPLCEIDFSPLVGMRKQQQILQERMQKQSQQKRVLFAQQHQARQQQQRLSRAPRAVAGRHAAATAMQTQDCKNGGEEEEAEAESGRFGRKRQEQQHEQEQEQERCSGAGGTRRYNLDTAIRRKRRSFQEQTTKRQHGEEGQPLQREGHAPLPQVPADGSLLSFALTTETEGACYLAVLHAGCDSVFVYDADFFGTGGWRESEQQRDSHCDALLQEEEEEQQRLHAPVLRFSLPPLCAGSRPATLAFLSVNSQKLPAVSFFSPSPAVAACSSAAAPITVGSVLLAVRWVYPCVSRSKRGELKQGMLPAFTTLYSLPAAATGKAPQQVDPLFFPSFSAPRKYFFSAPCSSSFSPNVTPCLHSSPSIFNVLSSGAGVPPPAGLRGAAGVAAASSSPVAAAEQETLDAWRAAARLGVPFDTAAAMEAAAPAVGHGGGSSNSRVRNVSFLQKDACLGRTGCCGSSSSSLLTSSSSFLNSSSMQNICKDAQPTLRSSPRKPNANTSSRSDPVCSLAREGAYSEGFSNPFSSGVSDFEVDNYRWQSTQSMPHTAASAAAARGTGECPAAAAGTGAALPVSGDLAAEEAVRSSRHSGWNVASPFLSNTSSRYIPPTQDISLYMHESNRMNSSSSAGAGDNAGGDQGGFATQAFSSLQGETGWVQRWQLQQQKLLQRWQLQQRQQQQQLNQRARQGLYQSGIEIPPPPLRASFSRWSPSYPRLTMQRPAPYSFFCPYGRAAGLLPLVAPQDNGSYSAVLQQQQQREVLQKQQQQPYSYTIHALGPAEVPALQRHSTSSAIPPPQGLYSSVGGNCFPTAAAGLPNAGFPAQINTLQQPIVKSSKFLNRQTLFDNDHYSLAGRTTAHPFASDPLLPYSTPSATTNLSYDLLKQQQLMFSAHLPPLGHSDAYTANTRNTLQPLLPAHRSPIRAAAANSGLFDFDLSQYTPGAPARAGRSYTDACHNLQGDSLAASALRLSDSSFLQPFARTAWAAPTGGARTSIL